MRSLRRQLASLALVLTATVAGCGGLAAEQLPADPTRAVAEGARRTLEAGVTRLDLRVESPTAEYSAAGLVEPSRGRFRVEADFQRAPALRTAEHTKIVAVGVDRRTTLREYFARFEGERQRCWIGTHVPVGSYGGATSVEESVRLVAAALETLRERRVESATELGSDGPGVAAYVVTLKPPADREKRRAATRGDRGADAAARMLKKLGRPVRLFVNGDGRIVEMRLELRGYRPQSYIRGKHDPERVEIQARLSGAERGLDLRRPECTGSE